MSRKIFKDCKNLRGLYIKIVGSYVRVQYCGTGLYKKFNSYSPCIGYEGTNNPRSILTEYSLHSGITPNESTLYVSPDARVSRDMLRNSGYKITLSKSAADVVVVKDIDPYNNIATRSSNIFVYDTQENIFYFGTIVCNRTNVTDITQFTENIKEKIIEYLGVEQENLEFYHEHGLTQKTVHLIPKNDDYFDMLENVYGNPVWSRRRYCIDSLVPILPLQDLTIESMEMLRKMNITIFEKALIGLPWQKYPITLGVFLQCECEDKLVSNNKNVRMIIDETYQRLTSWKSQCLAVTPEDFDMLQTWIFHLLGIDDDTKGFIPVDRLSTISPEYLRYIRRKYAVSKLTLSEESSLSDIMNKVKQ